MFITNRDRCNWLRARIANSKWNESLSNEDRKRILEELIDAVDFEHLLQKKHALDKRFGLDGGESLIPGMKHMIRRASEMGVEKVIMGMPHRGRLNVLHNVFGKPLEVIFKEFKEVLSKGEECSGDVKYHVGMNSNIEAIPNKTIHMSLMANPSHLEAVDPVVLGRVRAEQRVAKDDDRRKVIGVLLHGDGAFAGQGVVFETLGMSQLRNYTTGGTIHIVVNNQVAFTTSPVNSRSSEYCTDVAKTVSAPIFHVNGDCPEDVVRCFDHAIEWQQTY
jgi:2-oxoglutarate dehydrogenase E1 component